MRHRTDETIPVAKKNNKAGKTRKAIAVTADNKCSLCPGTKCCQYITQQIDTPRSMADFDTLLWQVSHDHIQFYKDSDGWFMLVVDSPCEHLTPAGQCGIYETRPVVCRSYSNEECEFDADAEEGFELFFADHRALDDYCRERFKKWDKRFKKLVKKK